MVSSINEEPNGNTTNLDSRNKRSKIFCITCSSTAPSLEKQKSILNEMAEFVEIFIVFSLVFPVFSRRNDRNHSHLGGFEEGSRLCHSPSLPKDISPGNPPSVTLQKNRTGIPCASTAKCIWVLCPLLCGPSPDCRSVRQQRPDAL